MSSLSHHTRLRRLQRILKNPFEPDDPCDRCKDRRLKCLFIADLSIMSCSECTRKGRPCVTTSLEKLDRVSDDLSSKIEVDKAEVERLLNRLEEIRQRIRRNERIQEQNSRAIEKQVAHLVENMDDFVSDNPELSDLPGMTVDLASLGVESPFLVFPPGSGPSPSASSRSPLSSTGNAPSL